VDPLAVLQVVRLVLGAALGAVPPLGGLLEELLVAPGEWLLAR
jgi:hypothetical protein